MNRFMTAWPLWRKRLAWGPVILLIALTGCQQDAELKTGVWRAAIAIQGRDLPFNFEVARDDNGGYDLYLLNAGERLLLDEVAIAGDSVNATLHIFDANIKAKISGDSLTGLFIKNYADDYRLPFKAAHGQDFRFEKRGHAQTSVDFSGKYQVTFVYEKDTTEAIGLFTQQNGRVTGTFMTPTGDYRFLDGIADGRELRLSTFDGNYLYLFEGTLRDDGKIEGEFLSGTTWREDWVAERNENASLPDAESLTYLKEGYSTLAFQFPDADGRTRSLRDEKYRNKVVILQLLGTWCPNCMDETRFLAPWYRENRERGVEIIGLAYERKPDFDYASARVRKMVDKMDVDYDIVIAGTSDKGEASKTLPMLNEVVAFPTTIFIGKDGRVRKIHTGFSGPGTGKYFEQFKEGFNQTVNELLSEDFTAKK